MNISELCPKCLCEWLDELQRRQRRTPYRAYMVLADNRSKAQLRMSVILNTIPYSTDLKLLEQSCLCGHPWLRTAHEDYLLWGNGKGETDAERNQRTGHPMVESWLKQKELA